MKIFALLLSLFLVACGTVQPKTFNERLAYGYAGATAVRATALTLAQSGHITKQDAANVQTQADALRASLDIASSLSDLDPVAANDKLAMSLQLLIALESYLKEREAR